MSGQSAGIRIEAAVVTDRGLNERRPLNEDSYLLDAEHNIFVVADGVGGAEAGEVASKRAVEVIAKAFDHHTDGDDTEDLMEIAIQRANNSIFRMSREDPKLSMMATTIVALHLDGLRATVGHVGDSRLYRISAGGAISRETEDHSVVEEEVRAGRMTPEQAQHHPSRNVISRALGAEADVEVDLRTFEVEDGTTFLLCTDGITRHLSDGELRSLVVNSRGLQAACDEMKRVCFERGAEDNLTAVLVRVGDSAGRAESVGADEEQTIIAERPAAAPAPATSTAHTPHHRRPFDDAGASLQSSSVESNQGTRPPAGDPAERHHQAKRKGGAGRFFTFLLLLLAFSAAAFYGGLVFEQRRASSVESVSVTPTPSSPSPAATPQPSLDEDRARVDAGAASEARRMDAELKANPSKGEEARFRYLFGRALLLSGSPQDALPHFEKARGIIEGSMTGPDARLLIDTRLATVVTLLRANNVSGARAAADEIYKGFPAADASGPPSQVSSPQAVPAQQF